MIKHGIFWLNYPIAYCVDRPLIWWLPRVFIITMVCAFLPAPLDYIILTSFIWLMVLVWDTERNHWKERQRDFIDVTAKEEKHE